MQRVGEILKTEREKKGLSHHEIGMSLKINPKIIKAIEDNDPTQLPAKTFLRGFVRSYAQYLRLDVKEILLLLHSEIGPTRPEEPQKIVNANPPSEIKTPEKKKKLPAEDTRLSGSKIGKIAGSIVLVLLIIFVAKTVDKYQKESKRPPFEIQDSQKLEEPTALTQAPGALSEGPVVSLPDPEPVANPVSEEVKADLSHPRLPVPVLAIDKPHAPVSKSQAPASSPTQTPTPVPITAAPPPKNTNAAIESLVSPPPLKPVEVIVEALSKVDIRYSFDNEKWETLVLQTDQFHTFNSKVGLKLEISDGGAVSLIINGRERGVPGSIGKSIKLSYPK